MNNPIEIIYCWQSILVALTCVGITQLVKTIIDIGWGHVEVKKRETMPPPDPEIVPGPAKPGGKRIVGKDKRKSNVYINRLVMPMTPVVVGMLFAALIPLRPEPLIEFVAARVDVGWHAIAIYAAWGAACGQFSAAVFDKAKDFLIGMATRSSNNEG